MRFYVKPGKKLLKQKLLDIRKPKIKVGMMQSIDHLQYVEKDAEVIERKCRKN